MGLTKDYLRYVPAGVCNVVGSANGAVEAVDRVTCAVSACENVNFYNMRTLEKAYQVKREGHTVTTFKFSKDRRLLAIGYDDGEVHLYDRAKGKASDVVVFAGHRTGVNCLAFSHDGLTLASGGKDSVIILWDIVNESGVFRLNGHKGSVTQLQFSLDNKCLVSSSKDYTLKFWSLETQSCFYTIAECTSEIYTFALLKADRLLVVGSAELELRVFELTWLNRLDIKEEDESVVQEKENEPAAKKTHLPAESFPGAEHLDEESAQGNTILRCRKRGALVRQAKGRALQISVSKDEALLCCVGGDALLDVYRIYDEAESRVRFQKKLRKAKKRAKEDGSSLAVNEAEISKDVTLLLSRIGDYRADAKVKWVDVCGAFKKLDEHTREYRLYVLHQNNSVHGVSVKVDWRSNAVEAASLVSLDKRGHRSDVRCLTVASNDAAFLSGAAESAILWDMNSLLPVNTLTDDAVKDITGALFVPGDKNVVLGTKDGSLFLFDLATCELVEASRKVHEGTIWDMVQLPDKKGFVSCGADKKARFWTYELVNDLSTKRLSIRIERMLELPDEALCCAISPNGKFIVFGLLDNTARVYYLDSLKFFVSLYGHSLPVTCVDVGPDNKLVVTGSADKSVKIWGLDFGDCHKSLFAHDDVVTCVKFNPGEDEKLFWSAGKDGKVKQWDAVKFDCIQTLNGHSAEVRALTRTADGNTLISASHDKSIRLWELSDEIIVLQEQEELEREKEAEERLLDAEDIVPGEASGDKEADLAPKKSIETIKSTENILEAIDIIRTEALQAADDPKHKKHPLIEALGSATLDHFVVDVIHKIRSGHLEKSLMMIPFSYVGDILRSLAKCVQVHYKPELSTRVVLFLVKLHHNQIVNSTQLLPVLQELRGVLPTELGQLMDNVGFNMASLRLLQLHLEERDNVKLFRDVSLAPEKAKEQAKKKKKPGKVKDVAVVRTLTA